MSYCVNCGVELEKGCYECPLCDTPVINPRETQPHSEKLSYPDLIKIPKSTHKRFLVFVISMVLLIPNRVIAVLDIAFWNSGISAYIFGATFTLWIWALFPMLWKKPLPLIFLQIDAIALIAYLNVFRLADNSTGWFESVAMPIVIALWAVAAIFILWYRKPKRKTYTAIAVTVAINVISYVMEICINMFLSGKLQIGISVAVTACSVPLIIFFVAMIKSKKLNAWASRKFFM